MEFERMFNTEQDCIDYIASIRWLHGFVCPVCGSIIYWKKGRIAMNAKIAILRHQQQLIPSFINRQNPC